MTERDRTPPQDLAAAYALGALGPEETREFEAHLAASPEARGELDEYREVAALLALASPAVAPDLSLRDRVLARGRAHGAPGAAPAAAGSGTAPIPPAARRGWGRTLPWLAAAASAVLAVGLGMESRDLRRELAAGDSALAERSAQLARREATLNSILEPGVELYLMRSPSNPAAEPGIQLFWDRRRDRVMLHAFNLPPAPSGRMYQLWFIRNGAPMPSVTFNSEADGHAMVQQIVPPEGGTISAAAVTMEPMGGSRQPTPPIRLLGSLERS